MTSQTQQKHIVNQVSYGIFVSRTPANQIFCFWHKMIFVQFVRESVQRLSDQMPSTNQQSDCLNGTVTVSDMVKMSSLNHEKKRPSPHRPST